MAVSRALMAQEVIMAIRISRRRFLKNATAAGPGVLGLTAMPYVSRAADRPQITHGVQSGDVGADGGVVWARADRPSQMIVEVATTESFNNARILPPIAALPESDYTAKMLLENLPAGAGHFLSHQIPRPLARQRFERAGCRSLPNRPRGPARRQFCMGRRCCRTGLGYQSRRWRHVYFRHHAQAPSRFPAPLRRHGLCRRRYRRRGKIAG